MADNRLYFESITSLRQVENVEEANKLLADGFVLLKLGERASTTKEGSMVVPIYILGKRKVSAGS